MLIDTRQQNVGPEGFSPNVQNQPVKAKSSVIGIIAFIFFSIITIGLLPMIYLPTTRNKFNRQQMKINEAASTIDVQLAQRRDTLVKLVDATKSSLKFEKELLTDVTKMRSMAITRENAIDANNQIESGFGRLLATFERYPEIKSIQLVSNLMSSADYQEREIAATRRLYNSLASEFNEKIVTWPANIPAKTLKLYTFPLFAASAEQKKDVSLQLN